MTVTSTCQRSGLSETGAVTSVTPGRDATCSAYVVTAAVSLLPASTAIVIEESPLSANSSSIASETTRALASGGTTVASIGVQTAERAGRARPSMTSMVVAATAPGRRMTAWERRYHRPRSSGPVLRERRSSLAPQRPNTIGEIRSAASAATTATTAPAMPMDVRKPRGKTVRVAIATATVAAEKTTERPAVRMVTAIASAVAPRRATSSR